jgi:hypothetical protein
LSKAASKQGDTDQLLESTLEWQKHSLREQCQIASKLAKGLVEESCNLAEQEDDPISYSVEEGNGTPKQTFSDDEVQ